MLLYEKKIGYLSVWQDGERKSSAGFIRVEREKNACRLEIHIKKNAEVYNGNYALMLVTKNRELPWGTVTIRKEKDFTEKNFPIRGDMLCFEDERVRESEVCGISIRLGEGLWISGNWKETSGSCFLPKENGKERDTGGESRTPGKSEKKAPDNNLISYEKREENREFMRHEFMERPILHAAGGYRTGDKWTQLKESYKTVHPFGDERTFITIELRNFNILKNPYQRLANNSFLLHGFYNYRHLILGPDKELGDRDGICFYLGVPGTYFEREKMVAVMFGFEGFECSGAVEEGKFGYYMRRVEV